VLATVAVTFAVSTWLGWRYLLAPPLPQIPLEGKDTPVQQAIAEAMSQVRWHPRSGPAWGQLGQVLQVHSFGTQAIYCYEQAQRFEPANPRWPYLTGVIWLPDAEAALPHLRRAAELAARTDRDNSAPRLKLAEALLRTGRLTEAKAQFERVLEDEPKNPRANYNLGVLAVSENQPAAAIAYLIKSRPSPVSRKKSCFQLALAQRVLGQASGSEDHSASLALAEKYSQEAAAAPEDRAWHDPYLQEINLLTAGRSYYYQVIAEMQQQKRYPEAIKLMEQVVEQFPDDDSYLELTQLLIAAKEYAKAETAARQTLQLRPDKVQGHYFLGVALFRLGLHIGPHDARGKFQEAEGHLAKAVELMPNHPLAHIYRGRCLRYLDRHADAAAAFRAALRHNPRQTEAYVFLSNLFSEDGKAGEARAVLEEGRAALPENADIRKALERLSDKGLKSVPAK
jgi:tetratricopeptide (TPR) repeat protein